MNTALQSFAPGPDLMRAVLPNLALAWLLILVGFAFGAVMGLFFARADWMGGYDSLRRRLYRLAHIAFFGLGFINLLFVFTASAVGRSAEGWIVAAWGFRVGAVTMPVCCLLMAHAAKPRPALLFTVPVASLLVAGLVTLWKVLNP